VRTVRVPLLTMDTEQKYRNEVEVVVELVGDDPDPRLEPTAPNASRTSVSEEHFGVPVDGWVTILYRNPDKESNLPSGKWKVGSFPFRAADKDEHPWFGFPEKDAGKKQPIWKWQNPDDAAEDLTLRPSIGMGTGDPYFHVWVNNGAVDFV